MCQALQSGSLLRLFARDNVDAVGFGLKNAQLTARIRLMVALIGLPVMSFRSRREHPAFDSKPDRAPVISEEASCYVYNSSSR